MNMKTFRKTAAVLLMCLSWHFGFAQTFSNPLYFSGVTGDKISLYANRLGLTNMYGFGVESNTLYFKTASHYRWYSGANANGGSAALMSLTSSGFLGLGTASPNHNLVIQGNDPSFVIRDDVGDNSVNAARIELLERAGGSFDGGAFMWWNGSDNKLYFGTKLNGVNSNVMVINRSGLNVGIGTSAPDNNYRLAVNGKIRAKEIVVETGWADYVFKKDYRLMPLGEVKAFIEKNGRLPGMPSAEEVQENGVSVGEMETKLLEKVEELTLYVLELKSQNETLASRLAAMEKGQNK